MLFQVVGQTSCSVSSLLIRAPQDPVIGSNMIDCFGLERGVSEVMALVKAKESWNTSGSIAAARGRKSVGERL